MIALIQRVNCANVVVDNETVAKIEKGLLVFVAVESKDDELSADKMLDKILNYRIFSDENGKMNLSLTDIKAELLLVSQFTLLANTDKGRRPSFSDMPAVQKSEALFNYLGDKAKNSIIHTELGVFGADMKVSLENDGPVTFWLEV